tara:strand:+ start:579 stop:815 length:237 start_codon:yes stop_codon:yes gene_type:complete
MLETTLEIVDSGALTADRAPDHNTPKVSVARRNIAVPCLSRQDLLLKFHLPLTDAEKTSHLNTQRSNMILVKFVRADM